MNGALMGRRYGVLLILLVILILAACNKDVNVKSSEEDTNEEKVYHLKMNSMNPPASDNAKNSATSIATEGFAELVEEKSNGRINIEVYYNNQLAGQSESLDALAKGTIDLQVVNAAAWADKIPEGNWSSLPFAWKGEEELHHLIRETEFGELYREALDEYGVKLLHYYYTSSAGYLSNVAIEKPEDMEGLVVNAVGTLKGSFYKEMGAGLASIPFADYYEGMLRGTIDVISFPYPAIESMKLDEVIDYMTIPAEIDPAVSFIAISHQTWDKLPADLQEIIMEASLEIEQKTMTVSKEDTEKALTYAKENGVEIIELDDGNYRKFVEIAKKTYWKGFADINERTKKMIEVLEDNLTE